MSYKIFIVEDDTGIAEGIAVQMKQWDLEAETVSDFTTSWGNSRNFSRILS